MESNKKKFKITKTVQQQIHFFWRLVHKQIKIINIYNYLCWPTLLMLFKFYALMPLSLKVKSTKFCFILFSILFLDI